MTEWGTTNRLRVRVRLADGEEVVGDLHLQPRVSHHNGPETPLDLLDRSELFFPLALPESGIRFIGKPQVVSVACAPIPAESELDRLGITRFVTMELSLTDGSLVQGGAGVTLPPTRHRALDCLNAGSGFLVLWSDETALYVNRAHIRAVRPLE